MDDINRQSWARQSWALLDSFEELWGLELDAKEAAAPFNKVSHKWNAFFTVVLGLSIYLSRYTEWGWVGGILIIGPGFWFMNLGDNYVSYRAAQKELEHIRWKDFDLRLQWRLLEHRVKITELKKLCKPYGRGIDKESTEFLEWWNSVRYSDAENTGRNNRG